MEDKNTETKNIIGNPEQDYIYFGDLFTGGSWRIGINENNFVHQRLEEGVWVSKHITTP